VGLADILEVRNGEDVTTYLYGLGIVGEVTPGGEQYFYGQDALGSVRFVLDGDAELVGRYEYGPFGDPYGHVGAGTSFQFAGELWDEASQLYYLRARHYNPALGRFMTRDPFAGLVQVPQTLHPYVYVGNNPINLTDPSGQFAPLVLVGIGAGSFVVGGGVAAWNYRQANPCSDLLHDPAFWNAVFRGGAIGVVGSVTAALVFTMMPVGCLGAAIQAGVISGVFGGGAAQVTANVLDEQPLYYGLDRAAVSGGLTGGVFGGASHGLSSIAVRRLPARAEAGPAVRSLTERHHVVPKQVLRRLPGDVSSAVRGRPGAPNRWSIPLEVHRSIHAGRGGGPYNEAWISEIVAVEDATGLPPTSTDVRRIGERLVIEFGLDR